LRPEPGQAGQVVSVNDDVVKSDRHIDSMRGALGCLPAVPTRPASSLASLMFERSNTASGRLVMDIAALPGQPVPHHAL
jgi:hypothetical protein